MKTLHMVRPGAAVLAALVVAGAAWAQTPPSPAVGPTAGANGASRGSLQRADRAFLEQAAQNNHAEIESSRLALQKATDPQVKAFAQRMVDEHGKTGAELASLAASKGLKLPDGPSMLQRAKAKLLEAADGPDFDRRYSETMGLQAHRETIDLFRKGAAQAKDAEVRAFAKKTLPALEHHLQMAQALPPARQDGRSSGAAADRPPAARPGGTMGSGTGASSSGPMGGQTGSGATK